MRNPVPLVALLLACSAFLAPDPAIACTVVEGYRVPTNLELAERADLILLGIAEREVEATGDNFGEVVVRPVELLKGDGLPAEIRIPGSLSEDRVTASDPRDLYNPNPGALTGACVRYVFRQGMLLLLFLERGGDGRLHLVGAPFARSAEDVPSADAPWAKAVRLYVEIAALPQAERRQALIARRDQLRARTDDPDAALLAEDIDRQLRRRRIPPAD